MAVGDFLCIAFDLELVLALDHDSRERLRPGIPEQQPALLREQFLNLVHCGSDGGEFSKRNLLPNADIQQNLRVSV